MCREGVEAQMMDRQELVVDQFQGFAVDHSMVVGVVGALPKKVKKFIDRNFRLGIVQMYRSHRRV